MSERQSGRRRADRAQPGPQNSGRRRANVPVQTGSHASLLGGAAKLALLSIVVGARL